MGQRRRGRCLCGGKERGRRGEERRGGGEEEEEEEEEEGKRGRRDNFISHNTTPELC